uniref:Uncharacterized protein n=1 Tax=Knipowitschia caucasica TaxID=637954 RepID=A0AAV2M5U4_KNICA
MQGRHLDPSVLASFQNILDSGYLLQKANEAKEETGNEERSIVPLWIRMAAPDALSPEPVALYLHRWEEGDLIFRVRGRLVSTPFQKYTQLDKMGQNEEE